MIEIEEKIAERIAFSAADVEVIEARKRQGFRWIEKNSIASAKAKLVFARKPYEYENKKVI